MIRKKTIYFDANASYGLLNEVKDSLLSFLTPSQIELLNPSSIHYAGQRAKAEIEKVRDRLKTLCGFDGSNLNSKARIVFSSGATESNNQALETLCSNSPESFCLITSTVEHPSVLEKAGELKRRGAEIEYVSPTKSGVWSAEEILELISKKISLGKRVGVSLMHSNNETGTVFNTEALFETISQKFPGVYTHSDAVQSLGRISVSKLASVTSCITFSAHKIGALSGVGALVCTNGMIPEPIIFGGPQELRARAGTENVIGIISFGIALQSLIANGLWGESMEERKKIFLGELTKSLSVFEVNCSEAKESLPNTLNIFVPGLEATDAVVSLDLAGVLVSSGSACASGKPKSSHVLKGFGYEDDRAKSSLRISFRHDILKEDLMEGAKIIVKVLSNVRQYGLSA